MRIIRRVIGSLLLITALLVTQIPEVPLSAAPSSDFQIDRNKLVKYTGTASSVSIPDSIKIIGEEAFAGNTSLTSINLGKNVTEIEYGAFKNCTYLNNITIPDTVTSIGNGAFTNNTSLKKITLPKNLESLGSGVFAGCDKLNNITVPKENTNFIFEKNVLYNKDKSVIYCFTEGAKSTSFSMPNSVIDIDEYAFWGNDSLKEIILSTNLLEIPSYAFSNCKNLLAVSIPYSVKNIQSKVFENCISLQKVMIPASVSYIHSTAFDGCPRLVISADSGSVAHKFYENWKILNHTEIDSNHENGDTVVDAGGNVYVVGSDGKLTIVEKNDNSNVTEATSSAINDPSNVDYVPTYDPIIGDEDGVLGKTMIVGQSAVLMMDSNVSVVNGTINRDVTAEEESQAELSVDESKGDALPKYAIIEDRITNYAYYGDSNLGVYSIPSNITSIGDFAFARSALKSIHIPQNVTSIGYAAFYHCDKLSEISIPASVTWVEPSAFAHTAWLNAWASNPNADDFLIVGDGVLIAYKGTGKYVQIPETVETIAPACFLGHSEIMGVNIPNSVTIIGEEAFKDCTSLQEVHGAANIVKIQDRAFENTALKEFTVHEYVQSICIGAFRSNDDSNKYIIFKGEQLPQITHTEVTSRLSNDLLTPVFEGNWTAIVQSEDIPTDNTVLDNPILGFEGDVATKGSDGTVKVFDTVRLSAEDNNSMVITSEVKEWPSDDISAYLNYTGAYHLKFKDMNSSDMEEAFKRVYGNAIPNMKTFSMSLWDTTDTVKFTNLDNNPIVVTVPLPTEIKGNTIHVVVLDEDGQLEKLSSTIEKIEDKSYVRFSSNYLSTFSIYAMGEDGNLIIKDGNAEYTTVSGKKDYSPNTGDNSIHPKWFIALGLSAAAIALMTAKPKKRRKMR